MQRRLVIFEDEKGVEQKIKIHTQTIEGLWKHLKDKLRKFNGISRKYFSDTVFFALFLHQNRTNGIAMYEVYLFKFKI